MTSAPSLRTVLAVLVLTGGFQTARAARQIKPVVSPDKKTEVRIEIADSLRFSIWREGRPIILPSTIFMDLDGRTDPGIRPKLSKTRFQSIRETLFSPFPLKRNTIPIVCNEAILRFTGGWGLIVRVFDDGAAYRFFVDGPGDLTVTSEGLDLVLSPTDSAFVPEETSFLSHSERLYPFMAVKDMKPDVMSIVPLFIAKADGFRVVFSESDLLDYPGLYLRPKQAGKPVLKALFPPFPLEEAQTDKRTIKITKTADFIARTKAPRNFPWRLFALSSDDKGILSNDLVERLASPCRLADVSWIRPGKVAWDWWNANNLFGVDFRAGINTETYRHYIDFASQHHIEYVIFDEGWSKTEDCLAINPDMDMEALFSFARSRGVGIILWVSWNALDARLDEALDRYARWGAKGIKVDFMQRDDQKMVNFYEKVAQKAADRKLLVDFHGSFKPTGLSRTYPNVLTREGVRGLENSKWSTDITPEHDVTIPFTRMFAGGMDYTPGAMNNAIKENFKPIFDQPMSQGTRCHQLAMYVVYESPLQMLCDSPSQYRREPEAMDFLSNVPTVWDRTVVLNAKAGDFLTVARKRGNSWYIGSMTDWSPRDFVLSLDFLDGDYRIDIWQDGPNADRWASDFVRTSWTGGPKDTLTIHLAPGGGWAARLTPQNTSGFSGRTGR